MKAVKKILSHMRRKRVIRELGYIPYRNADLDRESILLQLSWPKSR